ncbi:MAG: GlsB/YeaQ/YmgE family stress response membrane protein [Candidatus Devosia euplotis]|nr:GlsB/YeaQ/YmgE family stress response membrane protein [Candidatus Devosia euplotis]
MAIIWAIIIGFLAGLIAKWIAPGDNRPSNFILTAVPGIIGSVLATWLGQQIFGGAQSQGIGFVSGIIGTVIILLIWNQVVRRRA